MKHSPLSYFVTAVAFPRLYEELLDDEAFRIAWIGEVAAIKGCDREAVAQIYNSICDRSDALGKATVHSALELRRCACGVALDAIRTKEADLNQAFVLAIEYLGGVEDPETLQRAWAAHQEKS